MTRRQTDRQTFVPISALCYIKTSVAIDPDYGINEISAIIDSVPVNGLVLQPIPEYEIFKLLNSVKKTSPGHDCILYWVFKHCTIELTPVITSLTRRRSESADIRQGPRFWPTVLSLTPLAHCVVCLSVYDILYCDKMVRLS